MCVKEATGDFGCGHVCIWNEALQGRRELVRDSFATYVSFLCVCAHVE
jgi:hypothetical protein